MTVNAVVLTTGPLLTLAEAKEHLRVDYEDENTLIQAYADAAVQRTLTYTDRQLVPVGAEPSFKAAALLYLGDLYAVRETNIVGLTASPNGAADALLWPYRNIRI